MNIQAHAGFPPIPAMFEIAAYGFNGDETLFCPDGYKTSIGRTASNPPKAPDTVAAEKNIAARIPNSDLLYQLYILSKQKTERIQVTAHHER